MEEEYVIKHNDIVDIALIEQMEDFDDSREMTNQIRLRLEKIEGKSWEYIWPDEYNIPSLKEDSNEDCDCIYTVISRLFISENEDFRVELSMIYFDDYSDEYVSIGEDDISIDEFLSEYDDKLYWEFYFDILEKMDNPPVDKYASLYEKSGGAGELSLILNSIEGKSYTFKKEPSFDNEGWYKYERLYLKRVYLNDDKERKLRFDFHYKLFERPNTLIDEHDILGVAPTQIDTCLGNQLYYPTNKWIKALIEKIKACV